MPQNYDATPIEKEQIQFLKFPKQDVLSKKNEQLSREFQLRRALTLGNLEHQKVKIFFLDESGIKKVETTIWGITDKSVILKKGTIIPRKRIMKVS